MVFNTDAKEKIRATNPHLSVNSTQHHLSSVLGWFDPDSCTGVIRPSYSYPSDSDRDVLGLEVELGEVAIIPKSKSISELVKT